MFLTSAFYFFFFLCFIFLLVNLPDNSSSVESLNMKEWQDGLRALLPNININFGGLPNSSSPSNANHSAPTSNTATTDSLSWESPGSWTDPAIITGNSLAPFSCTHCHQFVLSTALKKKKKELFNNCFFPQSHKLGVACLILRGPVNLVLFRGVECFGLLLLV